MNYERREFQTVHKGIEYEYLGYKVNKNDIITKCNLFNTDYIIIYEYEENLIYAPCNLSLKDFYNVTKSFYPKAYVINAMLYTIGYINI